jgi:hypothetical protein
MKKRLLATAAVVVLLPLLSSSAVKAEDRCNQALLGQREVTVPSTSRVYRDTQRGFELRIPTGYRVIPHSWGSGLGTNRLLVLSPLDYNRVLCKAPTEFNALLDMQILSLGNQPRQTWTTAVSSYTGSFNAASERTFGNARNNTLRHTYSYQDTLGDVKSELTGIFDLRRRKLVLLNSPYGNTNRYQAYQQAVASFRWIR